MFWIGNFKKPIQPNRIPDPLRCERSLDRGCKGRAVQPKIEDTPRVPALRHILLLAILPLLSATAKDSTFDTVVAPLFQKNCVQCHGQDDKVKGKVNLLELASPDDQTADPELIQDIIFALEDGEMPPEDEPQPSAHQKELLLAELEKLLLSATEEEKRIPTTPIRRMNRFQYSNAVEDLFELDIRVFTLPEKLLRSHGYFDAASGKMPKHLKAGSRPLGKSQLIEKRLDGVAPFPQDLRAEHGYDNQGDHLSLSPLLMESFLQLSRSIVESPDFTRDTCWIWDDFFAEPDGEISQEMVRERLRSFLTRAFRKPADDAVLDRYSGLVMAQLAAGTPFTDAMKAVASAAIASPRFLYLYDGAAPTDGVEPLNDFELASRLSFFLWGSLPDQELLDLASEKKLSNPGILAKQVDRMLKDNRVKRFCDSFPGQWLQLDRIVSSVPDPEMHPEFYFAKYRASMHMMLEPLLLFETVLIEDRSILDLIDPDFSYRSDLLKSWYRDGTKSAKIPPTAIPFQRVPIVDRREGGVITNAAVMTMTSNATRSQPITRGAWLLSVIFNDPPEPPPADVPPLPEEPEAADTNLTLRERLDDHRERADCRGCHEQIDPLGFALENYGPTGLWRDEYENGREVDASGKLFRKREFSDPVEFKDAILAEKERFTRAFAGHLLAFALGRETTANDSAALDAIATNTMADGYRMKTLLKEIVSSEPFLYKSNPESGDR